MFNVFDISKLLNDVKNDKEKHVAAGCDIVHVEINKYVYNYNNRTGTLNIEIVYVDNKIDDDGGFFKKVTNSIDIPMDSNGKTIEFDLTDIYDDIIDIVGSDFIAYLPSNRYYYVNYLHFYNNKYLKPAISGKYKTHCKIMAPIKRISEYMSSYYYKHCDVIFNYNDAKNIQSRFTSFNDNGKKIITKIEETVNKCLNNFNNIKIPDILSFTCYISSRGYEIKDIRGYDGVSINPTCFPEPLMLIKKCVNSINSNNFINLRDDEYTGGFTTYLCVDNILETFDFKCNSNTSGDKFLYIEHKKNPIQANIHALSDECMDKIIDLTENQDDIDNLNAYKLLTML